MDDRPSWGYRLSLLRLDLQPYQSQRHQQNNAQDDWPEQAEPEVEGTCPVTVRPAGFDPVPNPVYSELEENDGRSEKANDGEDRHHCDGHYHGRNSLHRQHSSS